MQQEMVRRDEKNTEPSQRCVIDITLPWAHFNIIQN